MVNFEIAPSVVEGGELVVSLMITVLAEEAREFLLWASSMTDKLSMFPKLSSNPAALADIKFCIFKGWILLDGAAICILDEEAFETLPLNSESEEWWSTWTTCKLLAKIRVDKGGAIPNPMFLSW